MLRVPSVATSARTRSQVLPVWASVALRPSVTIVGAGVDVGAGVAVGTADGAGVVAERIHSLMAVASA